METVWTFVKYNPKLLAELDKLSPLEKYLIREMSNPDTLTEFGDEWVERKIRELQRKYGRFTEKSVTIMVDHADEQTEDIIYEAVREELEKHGFVDYYEGNPFSLNKQERQALNAEIAAHEEEE